MYYLQKMSTNLKAPEAATNFSALRSSPRIYFIPGLGTDTRIYAKYHFPGYEMVYMDFIPHQQGESLAQYAVRLATHYKVEPGHFYIGTSLGGMIAGELHRHLPAKKTFIISSLKNNNELPSLYKLGRYFPLYNWIPDTALKQLILYRTARLRFLEKSAHFNFREMVEKVDPAFIKWAIHSVLGWKRADVADGVIHFHGSMDRLFPKHKIGQAEFIAHGSHFMLATHSDLLQAKIQAHLSDYA